MRKDCQSRRQTNLGNLKNSKKNLYVRPKIETTLDVLVGTNKSPCKHAEYGEQFERTLKLNTSILYTDLNSQHCNKLKEKKTP